ncbi:hypothetical protein M5689_008915 [Euphorbia peplus]|nr:hypothetical protein M5689_008915 [Euphorbia peplus]
MCSNTSLSSSGGGGSGGDNDGGYGGGDSIYSKKQRRQKVPKRGPGVAELEKILREQENHLVIPLPSSNNSNSYRLQSSSISPSCSSLPVISSVSSSISPNLKHFNGGKSGGIWNSNCEVNNSGENGSGKIGGSSSSSRFQLLPLNGSSCSQIFSCPSSSNNLMQTTRQHSPPSTKNLFPNNNKKGVGNGMSSSLTTLSGPGHGREPPSNQTLYRHSALWPDEDKMVGEKRGRSFAMEIPPVPPFRYHIPTFSAQMNMNMNRVDTPFPCDSRTLFNLDPPDYTLSREMRQTTCLEPNSKKQQIEQGESESNFLIYPSPNTPPSLYPTPNIFNPFPFQESNGDLQHNFGINHHHQGGTITKKPFYSFLPPREKFGSSEGLNTERVETREDAIDLDLRL